MRSSIMSKILIFYYGVWGVDLYIYYCIYLQYLYFWWVCGLYMYICVSFFLVELMSFIEDTEIF